MTHTWLEGNKTSILCDRNEWSWLCWESHYHFLIMYTWDIVNVNANRTTVLLKSTKRCSNHESPSEQLRSYLVGKNLTRRQSLGLVMWKVMRRNARKYFANWQIKRLNSCTRSLLNDWTIITSKRKEKKELKMWKGWRWRVSNLGYCHPRAKWKRRQVDMPLRRSRECLRVCAQEVE